MLAALLLAAVSASSALAQTRVIPESDLRSGATFGSAQLRAMQSDDFANPGMLWVERGESLWKTPPSSGERACESCHGRADVAMKGIATRYPVVDAAGHVVDLEARINACRTTRQHAPALARESEDLLALTAFVAHQSRGLPLAVALNGDARAAWAQGRDFYYARHGQMDLSCADCHERNWGRRLLGETISQGHPNAFPAYRLEWQSIGSIARRIRACLFGIRAQMLPANDPRVAALELFLAWRADGLPVETPGVRR